MYKTVIPTREKESEANPLEFGLLLQSATLSLLLLCAIILKIYGINELNALLVVNVVIVSEPFMEYDNIACKCMYTCNLLAVGSWRCRMI
jgi:hypothetical protein